MDSLDLCNNRIIKKIWNVITELYLCRSLHCLLLSCCLNLSLHQEILLYSSNLLEICTKEVVVRVTPDFGPIITTINYKLNIWCCECRQCVIWILFEGNSNTYCVPSIRYICIECDDSLQFTKINSLSNPFYEETTTNSKRKVFM